jgi:hypothetical protein
VSHHIAETAGNQAWIENRSHSKSSPGPWNLPVGNKNLRCGFIGQMLAVTDVVKYANDLPFRCRPGSLVWNKLSQQQALIEGVYTAQKTIDKALADNDSLGAAGAVIVIEETALNKPHAEGLEVTWRNDLVIGDRPIDDRNRLADYAEGK